VPCAFPGVTALSGPRHETFTFEPDDFPALRALSIDAGAKGEAIDLAARLPALDDLEVRWLRRTHRVFDRLAAAPALTRLSLSGGDLSTLRGVAQLRRLEHLTLSGFDELRDLSPLASLPALTTLTVRHATALNIGESFDGLIRLRGLRLWMCGDLRLTEVDQDRLVESIPELDLGNSAIAEVSPKRDKQRKRARDAAKKHGNA
jgi:Leucine-rich repeat (LRR) protein